MSNETTPTTTTTSSSSSNEVRIWVERDEDANRVSAVLEALGYVVLRELEEGDGPARLRWAVNRLARRHKLTPREQDILERVLAGRNNEEIGKDLEISRATVKWHMHNIFAKTNTGNRESLLRLALQLGGRRSQDEAVNEAETVNEAHNDEAEAANEAHTDEAPAVPQSQLNTEPHRAANTPDRRDLIPAAAVPSKSWF